MNINIELQALKEVAKHIGKRVDASTQAIVAALSSKDDSAIDTQTRTLSRLMSRVEAAVNKIKNPTFSGDITLNASELRADLAGIEKAVRDKDIPVPDLAPLVRGVQMVLNKLGDLDNAKIVASLSELTKAVKGLDKKQQSVAIDDNQLKSLQAVFVGGGETMLARNVVLANVAMATADTQYSYTFPANTLSWRMKLRSQNASWNYAWSTGTLKESGDASAYISIPANWLDSRAGMDFSRKTIYFESGTASQTMEIEVNTA